MVLRRRRETRVGERDSAHKNVVPKHELNEVVRRREELRIEAKRGIVIEPWVREGIVEKAVAASDGRFRGYHGNLTRLIYRALHQAGKKEMQARATDMVKGMIAEGKTSMKKVEIWRDQVKPGLRAVAAELRSATRQKLISGRVKDPDAAEIHENSTRITTLELNPLEMQELNNLAEQLEKMARR
ncbi:MAG: hypothetical protein AABW99_01325 [archaeon]